MASARTVSIEDGGLGRQGLAERGVQPLQDVLGGRPLMAERDRQIRPDQHGLPKTQLGPGGREQMLGREVGGLLPAAQQGRHPDRAEQVVQRLQLLEAAPGRPVVDGAADPAPY